ncbi:aconitase X swivel domain-containing protein [Halalkalibacter oceani]|uniref:aconitase X swivel domain-containing protein n=1 Tax=Halalkalibacter oceani TaxID=1653776 RepID=UPI0033990A32
MAEKKVRLNGRKIFKGQAKGEAIVCTEAISFNGGVDNLTGIVTEPGHQLKGQNIAGKVLIFTTGKGSTGGSYKIYDMAERGTGPVAFIQISAEPVTTIGAIMANIPVIAECDQDPTLSIETGDYVELDADKGSIIVTKRNGETV